MNIAMEGKSEVSTQKMELQNLLQSISLKSASLKEEHNSHLTSFKQCEKSESRELPCSPFHLRISHCLKLVKCELYSSLRLIEKTSVASFLLKPEADQAGIEAAALRPNCEAEPGSPLKSFSQRVSHIRFLSNRLN
jgi:hypothetical protein